MVKLWWSLHSLLWVLQFLLSSLPLLFTIQGSGWWSQNVWKYLTTSTRSNKQIPKGQWPITDKYISTYIVPHKKKTKNAQQFPQNNNFNICWWPYRLEHVVQNFLRNFKTCLKVYDTVSRQCCMKDVRTVTAVMNPCILYILYYTYLGQNGCGIIKELSWNLPTGTDKGIPVTQDCWCPFLHFNQPRPK
jgi:hypothetical protein